MGKAGKVLAIIGAAVGSLSVLLGLFLPELLSWYRIETVISGIDMNFYLTGFGTLESNMPTTDEIATLVLIGGILVLAGAGLCIVGVITEMKPLGIIGGILMLVGPLLLLVDILANISDYATVVNNLVDASNGNIFWDSFTDVLGDSATWSIWIGFFMAIGGGILGLIGGATV